MASFSDLLNTKTDDIPEVQNLPVGHYVWEIMKPLSEPTQMGQSDWESCHFLIKVISAEDDVDEDALEDFGDPAGEIGRYQFMNMITDDKEGERSRIKTANQLKKFCEDVLELEGETLAEMLPDAVKCRFIARVSYKPNKNTGEPDMQITGAVAED